MQLGTQSLGDSENCPLIRVEVRVWGSGFTVLPFAWPVQQRKVQSSQVRPELPGEIEIPDPHIVPLK